MTHRARTCRAVLTLLSLAIIFPADHAYSALAWTRDGHLSKLLIKAGQSDFFTLDSDLQSLPEGLALAPDGSANLHGEIDPGVRALRVNGRIATIDADRGWSFTIDRESGMLIPGVNRVLVQAFDGDSPDSELLGQRRIDIFFDNGESTEVSGRLETDEFPHPWDVVRGIFGGPPWHEIRWSAAGGPYHVTADVIVPRFYRLVIEPGVTLFFDENTRLMVNGELHAAGSRFKRIHMRNLPGQPFVADIRPELNPGPPRWSGVQFLNTRSAGNLIARTDIENAQTTDGSIGVIDSRLRIDDVGFAGTHQRMIFTSDSSLIVENCIFPDMFARDEFPARLTPPIDNYGEQIKGINRFPDDEFYIIRNNYFGTNKGHNDVIDVDSNQYPDAILQVVDNYFAGAGDEAIDGGGDILVEGNVFLNFVKDFDNDGDGEANAISTGDTLNTVMMMARNLFINVDHVVNFKRGAYGYFENNTVIGISPPHKSLDRDPPHRMLEFSVINFLIPDRTDPLNSVPRDPAGFGAYTSGNVYVDVPQTIFGHPDLNPTYGEQVSLLEFNRSLVESDRLLANANLKHGRKFDYVLGIPEFVDPDNLDFRLRPGSPGYRAGPNGLDMGAMVAAGASISGEPMGTTNSDDATLTIGGPGIFSFVYRLDDGSWSDEVTIGDPADYKDGLTRRSATVTLTGLGEGPHVVYARGRNFAGVLQSEADATVSKTWIVSTR